MENDKTVNIQSMDEIPLGHKIAMVDLNEGDTILKYGHDIGKVVKSIKKVNTYMFTMLKQRSGRKLWKSQKVF